MDATKTIEKLNECLRHEWTGVAQYSQAGFVLSGMWREVYSDMFYDSAKESFGHARQMGEKIVAMGGIPTVERNSIKQTNELDEMLRHALEFEQAAVRLYTQAITLAEEGEGDRALVVFLEDILKEEQEGVDAITRIVRQHSSTAKADTSATKAG
ncbi:MAG: ferritin-like domain-containing protein [Pirellulaceae bacterium]